MEPKFIVVGSHWINVNAIAQIHVYSDSNEVRITIGFIGSASEADQNALSLTGQEAQKFLSYLEAFKMS